MSQINVREAENQFFQLIERVRGGEEIFITEKDVPIVRLTAVGGARVGRRFGALAGRARIDARFFESLPESELTVWES